MTNQAKSRRLKAGDAGALLDWVEGRHREIENRYVAVESEVARRGARLSISARQSLLSFRHKRETLWLKVEKLRSARSEAWIATFREAHLAIRAALEAAEVIDRKLGRP